MITVYLKPGCPFCQNTENLIDSRNIKANKITLDTEEKRNKIKKKNKFNTFPQVFVDNKLIGGNDDFVRIIDMCDKLNGMLNNINDDVIQIILKLCCEISDGNNCKINKLLKKQQPKKKSKKNKK